MKKVGFIVEGASEVVLFTSSMFKDFLNQLNLESVGVFDAMGRSNLINQNNRIENFFKILKDNGAEKVFVISDLETDPCINYHKSRIPNYSTSMVKIVAVKAIEAWLLSDSKNLSTMVKKKYNFPKPEETKNLPIDTLQEILLNETGRGLGIATNPKPKVMKKFINNGFSLDEAAKHPNCNSVKYFIKKLEEFAKE